jgi:hypothetical protein
MRELSGARIQPAATAEVAHLGDVADAGGAVPALLVASPARLTWAVRFPAHAELDASVALVSAEGTAPPSAANVTVRVGISDARAYEELFRLSLTPGPAVAWQPVRVDLGAYSGWKWSLFYRPSRITWQLIVAADPTPAGSVAWRTLRLQAR